MKRPAVHPSSGYPSDFYAWTQRTAESICRARFSEIDLPALAEEVSDMGTRDRREMRSRLTVLLMHLLKRHAQSERRSESSWPTTIVEQRRQLALLFADSPSLYRIAQDEWLDIYADAVSDAAAGTGVSLESFPRQCPYSLEQVLEQLLEQLDPGSPRD